MKNKAALILIAAVAFLGAIACKSATGPDDEDEFIGTWKATKAEFVSVADPNTKVDIVAQGSTFTLVLNASTFTMTIKEPGEADWVGNGTWSSSIDTMTFTWSSGMSGESQFDFTLSASQLTLEGGHMPHEFTPGNSEEAILNLILARQ
jgi:hypothetical protein